MRVAPFKADESEHRQHGLNLFGLLDRRKTLKPEPDILKNSQMGKESVFLKDHADTPALCGNADAGR